LSEDNGPDQPEKANMIQVGRHKGKSLSRRGRLGEDDPRRRTGARLSPPQNREARGKWAKRDLSGKVFRWGERTANGRGEKKNRLGGTSSNLEIVKKKTAGKKEVRTGKKVLWARKKGGGVFQGQISQKWPLETGKSHGRGGNVWTGGNPNQMKKWRKKSSRSSKDEDFGVGKRALNNRKGVTSGKRQGAKKKKRASPSIGGARKGKGKRALRNQVLTGKKKKGKKW